MSRTVEQEFSKTAADGTPVGPDGGPAQPLVRVLHINNGNLYGGVETILVTLARLRQLCPDMEPHFGLCEAGRLSEELQAERVPVYFFGRVRISRPWTVWRARRRLRRLLASEQFDFVICHMSWSLAVFGSAVRASRVKLGFWAHGFFHNGQPWLEGLAGRTRPDFTIANSCYTETGAAKLFPSGPRTVIYPPLTLPAPTSDEARFMARRQLGVDDETVVIIQVSRLESWKGHQLHLEALSQLKTRNKWVCWIVGGAQKPEEHEYLTQLQTGAAEMGLKDRVRFLGQRADVPTLLAAADIFCQPNQVPEPFGMVFVEALWAGLPIVTTALGGALEIVDQGCGLFVSPDQPGDLAAALSKLIESPELRARLGRGQARAVELCDPATQMSKLRNFFSQYNIMGKPTCL